MKLIPIIILLVLCHDPLSAQNILISNKAAVSFFSSTIVEDIEGKSMMGSSAIDAKTGDIVFKVPNTSFQFKKKLMQEHFNENYMESEKYPTSEFKGKLDRPIDLNANGNYKVNVSGKLTVHGVSKDYRTTADISVNNGAVTAKSVFKVTVADHNIKIPTLVFKNIAELVEVRIKALYQPKK
jgi:polyisoprenoid-binding protein YceI